MTDFTKLWNALTETGYIQNYLTFGDGNLRSWDWERSGKLLTGKARLLWDALLCGKPVSRVQLEKALSKGLVRLFLDRNICALEGKTKVSFGNHRLIYSHSVLFFVKRGSLEEGYYGDDSRVLLTMRPHLGQGRVLCVYTGSGAEAAGLAAGGGVQLDAEADPRHRALIETNFEINGACESRILDAGQTKFGGPYDLIMARVPAFLELPGVKLPALISGGPGGHERWEELLRRAPQELTEEGKLVFVGIFYCGKEPGRAAAEITEMFRRHKLNVSVSISSKIAMEFGIPLFNQTVAFAERSSQKSREELMGLVQGELEKRGYSHAYMIKGIAWKARKSAPGSTLDLSEHYYGTWFS